MHEFAAGQDTEKSWPVGMTGFGLGVTDQPGAEALTGTEALAGVPAAPASTIAARKMDTFAAFRLIRPPCERRRPSAGRTENTIPARPANSAAGAATAGRLVQNFMITPMLQSQLAGPLGRAQRPDGGERGGASSWAGRPGLSQAESMSRSHGMPNRSLAWRTAIPVSSGPEDSVRAPSQMNPFPTVLQVSNDGGGGLSVWVTGWPAKAVPGASSAARAASETASAV